MRTPERCPISYSYQDTDTGGSNMDGSTTDLLNGIRSHWSGYLPLIRNPFNEEVLQSQYEQGNHKIAQSWSDRISQIVLAIFSGLKGHSMGERSSGP